MLRIIGTHENKHLERICSYSFWDSTSFLGIINCSKRDNAFPVFLHARDSIDLNSNNKNVPGFNETCKYDNCCRIEMEANWFKMPFRKRITKWKYTPTRKTSFQLQPSSFDFAILIFCNFRQNFKRYWFQ